MWLRRSTAANSKWSSFPRALWPSRCRAGPDWAVPHPTGLGPFLAEGKPHIEVDGRTFLLERPSAPDVALVAGARRGYLGNLRYAAPPATTPCVRACADYTSRIVETLQPRDRPGEVADPRPLRQGRRSGRTCSTGLINSVLTAAHQGEITVSDTKNIIAHRARKN